MNNYLVAASDTIRQMPQNYMIAHNNGRVWLMEPDLAADVNLVIKVTVALMKFENKYEKDPKTLLEKILIEN